ncbi:MAG: BolA family transcriptional regulator [Gammaproteobacteria bacterium]|jgi:BolA family transcriptional regulator, general stress-responsive regulator|nr:BolA family transcriptional regulator [Gammaproteobacteria bacterium]MBT7603960.1 BolA family transcriptional regulator [Gammaproteobacteria bacterium]
MSVEKKIKHTLSDNFELSHLEVINESHMHSGPNTETHFKVILVSEQFEDVKLVQRHRKINKLLKYELDNGVHALSLHLFTKSEWDTKGQSVKDSPLCAK